MRNLISAIKAELRHKTNYVTNLHSECDFSRNIVGGLGWSDGVSV